MTPLQNPIYAMPEPDRAALESYCREELEGVPVANRSLKKIDRVKLLERHGEKAAEALVRYILPGSQVEDANQTHRKNNPGFDLLVNGKIRIQVKGRCWVELIDMAAPPVSHGTAWQSDLWIAVDFGPLIDGRWGPHKNNQLLAPKGVVDWYVAPTNLVKGWVLTHYGADYEKRVRLWSGKIEKYRRSPYHRSEIAGILNAFHHIEACSPA